MSLGNKEETRFWKKGRTW